MLFINQPIKEHLIKKGWVKPQRKNTLKHSHLITLVFSILLLLLYNNKVLKPQAPTKTKDL
jgi:hypothetical protein